MLAHKIIDALRGKSKELSVSDYGAGAPALRALAEQIAIAEKFDFTAMPFRVTEVSPWDNDEKIPGAIISLTPTEHEAWREGLVPLPAPVSWFECRPHGWRGFLITGGPCDWRMQTVRLAGSAVDVTGIIHRVIVNETGDGELFLYEGNEAQTILSGLGKPCKNVPGTGNRGPFGLVLYLALMLESRSTRITSEPAPVKLNAARAKRGLAPLPAHRIVRIVPDEFIRASRAEAGFNPRLPPRLHWRRSHIRHLSGDRKVLISRFLVGRAELGTVSHEYRIG
jgi:hypothetical protein